MRKLGITLIALSVLIMVGITYLIFTANQNNGPGQSEEEFLESVQNRTPASGGGGVNTAVLPPANSGQGLPVMRVETTHFDMGLIKNDDFSYDEMKVYNDGEAPLVISRVTTSCGCTTGQMESNTIPPKGEGVLRIKLDPYRIPGFKSTKVLTIISNDPANSRQQVKVSAQVNPEIKFSIDKIAFGEVMQGIGGEVTFKVTQVDDQPFKLTNAAPLKLKDVFSASAQPVPEEEWATPGFQEYLVTARVSPDAPIAVHKDIMKVDFDLKRLKYMYLSIEAEVKGVYALTPRSLRLRMEPGQRQEGVLTLSSSQAVELLSVTSKNEFLKISHHSGDDPNLIVFDMEVMGEGIEQRVQTDELELKLKINGKEITEKVPVVVLLTLDAAEAESEA